MHPLCKKASPIRQLQRHVHPVCKQAAPIRHISGECTSSLSGGTEFWILPISVSPAAGVSVGVASLVSYAASFEEVSIRWPSVVLVDG